MNADQYMANIRIMRARGDARLRGSWVSRKPRYFFNERETIMKIHKKEHVSDNERAAVDERQGRSGSCPRIPGTVVI